jgi:hypothetical protein
VRCVACPTHSFGIIFSLCEWVRPKCWDVYRSSLFNEQNLSGDKLILIIAVCLSSYEVWLGNKYSKTTM